MKFRLAEQTDPSLKLTTKGHLYQEDVFFLIKNFVLFLYV